MANQFHGVNWPCASFVPSGAGYAQVGNTFVCTTAGAIAGERFVSGDRYIAINYEYTYSHVW